VSGVSARDAALPFGIALAAYLVLRGAGSYAGIPETSLPANPVTAIVGAAGTYLRLLAIPHPQNAYIADLPAGNMALAANAIIVAAFVALLVWAWKRNERAWLFSLLWIAVTLAPSFGVIAKPSTAPLAERYLYLPSVGFCWALGLGVARAQQVYGRARGAVALAAVSVAIVAGAGAATMKRNSVWADNYSLWSDTAEKNDVDGLPLRSLAAATLEKGDAQTAERLFLQALERRNTTRGKYIIYNNLGTIALGRNDDVVAERYYRQAAEFEPAPALLYNLGLIRLRRGMDPSVAVTERTAALTEAKDLFERGIAASPHDAEIHVGLAQTADALGDHATARKHFAKGLDLGLPPSTATAVQQRLQAIE
jgi:tetratricopeptide (TPR) repeat protein